MALLVLVLVGIIELHSILEVCNQLLLVLVPQLARRKNVLLALLDHLSCNLLEECCHPSRRVVVPAVYRAVKFCLQPGSPIVIFFVFDFLPCSTHKKCRT